MESTLARYEGREGALFAELEKKYGVPVPTVAAAGGGGGGREGARGVSVGVIAPFARAASDTRHPLHVNAAAATGSALDLVRAELARQACQATT